MIGEAIAEIIGSAIVEFIFEKFLNYFGGTIRWIFGTAWSIIANEPMRKYRYFVKGPENKKRD